MVRIGVEFLKERGDAENLSSLLKHPIHLSNCDLRVGEMFEDSLTLDRSHRTVGVRQTVRVGNHVNIVELFDVEVDKEGVHPLWPSSDRHAQLIV